MCDSLRLHELKHARFPWPSLSPWVCSNSCPLNQWCHPTISAFVVLCSSCPQSFLASGSFPELVLCIRWPKYWSFSISPCSEYSGLIFFRIDWFDLLAIQGTLKSLLQHHSSTASILQGSALSIVQLSYPYMTTGNTISLTIWTFVGKLMSQHFNMLPRFVIEFLPSNKCVFISWLQSLFAVILESKKIVCHCFHLLPIYFPWSDRITCHDPQILNGV